MEAAENTAAEETFNMIILILIYENIIILHDHHGDEI